MSSWEVHYTKTPFCYVSLGVTGGKQLHNPSLALGHQNDTQGLSLLRWRVVTWLADS